MNTNSFWPEPPNVALAHKISIYRVFVDVNAKSKVDIFQNMSALRSALGALMFVLKKRMRKETILFVINACFGNEKHYIERRREISVWRANKTTRRCWTLSVLCISFAAWCGVYFPWIIFSFSRCLFSFCTSNINLYPWL